MSPVDQVDSIAQDLEKIVSPKYVSTSMFERIKSAVDPMPYELERDQIPYVVTVPADKGEVSEVVKYANAKKIPLFVRGSGTHLGGASRPHTSGIVLSTRRLNKMEILDDYGFFECGPGCICAQVEEALKERGSFLPMAPGSRLIASMGGLVANNTSGHVVDASIGKPGDYVYGLEVVLPSGEIIETGTMGLRRPAGVNLTNFFVGSDGLLGIITKIRMRLLPPVYKAYGVAIYDDLIALARAVQRMYREMRPAPLFMEFMDHRSAQIGYAINGLEPPKGSVLFFVSIGSSQEEAFGKADQILESLIAEKPIEASQIKDIHLWEKMWSSREVLGNNLMQRDGYQFASAEVVSNLKDLPECMKDMQNFTKGLPVLSQVELYLYGHIGALTFHPGILIPRLWDNEKKRAAIDERFQKETELNLKYRTCGGEWGQLGKRTPFFIQRYGQASYDLFKGMKTLLDPNNILNPGILEGYR
jgi:glycolate oxidase